MGKVLLKILLGLSLFLLSCSEENNAPAEIIPQDESEIFFTKSMDFDANGGMQILRFSTNKKWQISVADIVGNNNSWFTLSQTNGNAGDIAVQIKVTANESYDDRNVVLTIQAEDLTKTIIVNQKAKSALTITTDRFEVDNKGGTINVQVQSNISYTVIIPEEYQDWIKQSTNNTRALENKSLKFEIAESKEYNKRTGEIIIKGEELSETIKVYQTGSAILILSQNEYTVSDKGETIAIDIKSNFEFEVENPNVDWVTLNQTRSVSSHTLYYTISPNTTYDKREASIIFKDKNSDKKETVVIKQVQNNAILLSDNRIEINQKGGIFKIKVNSNIPYSITIPQEYDWIKQQTATRGLNESEISFKVEESEEYNKREGEIIVEGENVSETIKVYQTGSAILILSQNEYIVNDEGESIAIEVKSNFDFEVEEADVDWITADKTRSLSERTLYYKIAPNTTYEKREAIIVIKDPNSDKRESVTIQQIQNDAILLSSDRVEVDQVGGSFKVKVKSNVNYDVIIPEEYNWIKQQVNTRALKETELTFTVDKSEEYDKREGHIILTNNTISETIKVYQTGSAILILSQNEYIIDSNGGNIDIELKSNFDLIIENPKVDWITPIQTRAISAKTLHYSISPNITPDERIAFVVIKDKNSQREEKVMIKQTGKHVISLSPNMLNVSQIGGSYEITVTSNIEHNIIMPDVNWIKLNNNVKGLTSYKLILSIDSNQTIEERNANIEFHSIDQSVNSTLQITQKGIEVTNLSEKGTANCYIISDKGLYKFSTGNYSGDKAFLLWNENGESDIENVELKNGYIVFEKKEFNKGNAVISLSQNGTIVWSWHIWSTDVPADIEINGKLWMDRNLGATSNKPNDEDAYGLEYNFGNPNPFPGEKYKDFTITEQPSVPDGWYVADGYGFYQNGKMPTPATPMLRCTNKDAYGNSIYFRHYYRYQPFPLGYDIPSNAELQRLMGYEPNFNGYNGILVANNFFIPANITNERDMFGRYWCAGIYNRVAVDGRVLFFYDGLSKQTYDTGNRLLPIRVYRQ